DMQLFPAFSTEASTVAAEITVYNFENKIELGKPIEMTLKQKDSTRQSLHTIDCCTNPIGPHKKTIIQTVIKEKSFRIDQVEAKTLN
ncbi:MAG: hypothetical protein KDD46_06405, partial [Bdellovibrionales bacterium]|nr:hypothetical protein [Bdellovibrionales bacterium]